MQRLTKHYPERIENSLIKYNSSIVLNKVLILLAKQLHGDCTTYYTLKLLKSQARYIPMWRKENIHIVNGVSRNLRIDMSDHWLVSQDATGGALGLGGAPGEGMHHPTEAASKWAVTQLLRNYHGSGVQKSKEVAVEGAVEVDGDYSMLSTSMLDANGNGDDRTIGSGVDGMLCLDGVDGDELLALAAASGGEESHDFAVDGVGVYSCYNDPATSVPHDFVWGEWLKQQSFLQ